MYRTVTVVTIAVTVLACAAHAADLPDPTAAPSPWFSEARWSALKTADSLASIGTGLSVNVYRWTPERALWLDGCLLYDAPRELVGGFGGLSTEIAGLPIIESMLLPLQVLTGGALDTVGIGAKYSYGNFAVAAYVTSHF